MEEKFEYKYEAPTLEERKEIDSIRNQYLPKDEKTLKLERIRYLDNKVKNIPMIISLSLGVVGLLCFGLCLTFFLEWTDYKLIGIIPGIIGLILIGVAYPIYSYSSKRLKNKYKEEIIKLSNELLDK